MDTNSAVSFLQAVSVWMNNWNLVLVVLILCSIIAAAVFLERMLYFRKMETDTTSFLLLIRQSIEEGNIVDAIGRCEETRGAVSNIVKAGLLKHDALRDEIENSMELRGLIEISKMEKNARILSMISHTAPLIGLLGTVIGFIKAFGEMRVSRLVEISSSQIGAAMEYALVTTAAGLVIAIPTVLAYNYLVSRVEAMTIDIQATASEVVDLIIARQDKRL